MLESNVFQMPTLLDRLATQIHNDLQNCQQAVLKIEEGRRQWREGAFNLCVHLAEARQQHTADIEFGQWCMTSGFGRDVINDDTRAAAIAMGRHPEVLRACLEATKRRSLEMIYRHEFGSVSERSETAASSETAAGDECPSSENSEDGHQTEQTGTTSQTGRTSPSLTSQTNEQPRGRAEQPVTEPSREMIDEVHRRLDAGESFTQAEIGERFGRGKTAGRDAVMVAQVERRIRAEAAPSEVAGLTPNMQQRYARVVERLEAEYQRRHAQLNAEIRHQVELEKRRILDEDLLPRYHQEIANRDRLIEGARRGSLTLMQYTEIRDCLHPDHALGHDVLHAKHTRCFQTWNDDNLKRIVVRPAEAPLPPSAVPRNYNEWHEGYQRMQRERATQRRMQRERATQRRS